MTLEQIGPYKIVRKIGEGGMGSVFEAIQDPIGRRVAVKILHAKYATDPQVAARFLNEAKAVNLIDHPGIVQISDYGQLPDKTAYLVMEFLKGETLSQRFKKPGGIALPEIVRMARQISSALVAAHEKQVFHRDLKPDNVMLLPDPDSEMPGRDRIKLLDFGIAKVAAGDEPGADGQGPKTATDVVMGTPRYMSPEQCRGGAVIDGKADVYSLGVMLFELLAGRPPFVGGSGEVLAAHIYENPPPLGTLAPHVPGDLLDLVQRFMAKKKEDRPTMAEAQQALDQISFRHPTSVLQAIRMPIPATAPGTPPSTPLGTPSGTPGLGQQAPASTMGLAAGQSEVPSESPRWRSWALVGMLCMILGATLFLFLWQPKTNPQVVVAPVESKPIELPVTPTPPPVRKIKWVLNSTPVGAHVVRASDNHVLGITPWQSEEPAAEGTLQLKLVLVGHDEKAVTLSRGTDENRDEKLEPTTKKPVRVPIRTGVGPSTKNGTSGKITKPTGTKNEPTGNETPRIVD